jgi:hypothetical protein
LGGNFIIYSLLQNYRFALGACDIVLIFRHESGYRESRHQTRNPYLPCSAVIPPICIEICANSISENPIIIQKRGASTNLSLDLPPLSGPTRILLTMGREHAKLVVRTKETIDLLVTILTVCFYVCYYLG